MSESGKILIRGIFLVVFGVCVVLAAYPIVVRAVGDDADKMCIGCVMDPESPKFCPKVPCWDITNGHKTNGPVCFAPAKCKTSPTGGGGASGLDALMKALGDLAGKLMQPKPPSPPPPPPPPPTGGGMPPATGNGCLGTIFQTSDVSLISNPCAQYTPAVSENIDLTGTGTGSCSPLNQALGLCTSTPGNCPDVPVVDCAPGNHPVSGGQDGSGCVLRDTCAPDTDAASGTPHTSGTTLPIIFATTTGAGGLVLLPAGAYGNITVDANGATIIGGTRDTQGNVEVAGFYGAETFGGQQSPGIVGAWCKARPWATNFLSTIITPSFFDGLCAWRGYPVGTPPPAPTVILHQTPRPNLAAPTTTTVVTSVVTPKVDIWAVPASVPLGARTSIFWNTQGVTNCTETSPSGGFNQNSLSGGAATQPITAATTFSISCIAPDGSPTTGSVTVNLKI